MVACQLCFCHLLLIFVLIFISEQENPFDDESVIQSQLPTTLVDITQVRPCVWGMSTLGGGHTGVAL